MPEQFHSAGCPHDASATSINQVLQEEVPVLTVLYVDDEPCLLDVAKLFLESTGKFRVLTSESGASALDLLAHTMVDAIVADYQMPGMDGIEFLRKVRADYGEIPFILFTGKGREEVAVEAINNGADSYLQKGGGATAQFVDLAQKIVVLIERYRARMHLSEVERKYHALLESSADAIFIARVEREKVNFEEINTRAISLFGLTRPDLHIADPDDLLPGLRLVEDCDAKGNEGTIRQCILLASRGSMKDPLWIYQGSDGTTPHYQMSLRRIDAENGRTLVQVTVRDIRGQKQALDALSLTNRKLSLLSAITRHDIRNRLMVLDGYLTLMRSVPSDPPLPDYIGKAIEVTRGIRKQVEFTKEYQDLGNSEPRWQDVRKIVEGVAEQVDVRQIRIETEFDTGVEIYADRMLENAFYNLVQNAVLHGKHATKITFTLTHDSGTLDAIVVQDNGVGILYGDKERIFERGFGRDSGLGLYLIREILAITGISITETGIPGEGARFEIRIPPSALRIGR